MKECTSVFIFQYILHSFINFVIASNNERHYDIFYKYYQYVCLKCVLLNEEI